MIEDDSQIFSDIKARIDKINDDIRAMYSRNSTTISLKEDVVLAYRKRLLGSLSKVFDNPRDSSNSQQLLVQLEELLENNWQFVKGTLCAYTSQPRMDLTLLLCDIATVLANAEKETIEKPRSAIEFLMPGIKITSISNSYKDLNELPLTDVLRTHITSTNGRYLIPVRIVVTPADLANPFTIPYFDYSLYESDNALSCTEEEQNCLQQHSAETRALFSLQAELDELNKGETTLLGQLQKLKNALFFNSRHMAGHEEDAANDVYGAIALFNEYWILLDEQSKTTVPPEVLTEIELLLKAATPTNNRENNVNRNHVFNIDGCIGNRSYELRKLLSNEDIYNQLALIRPGEEAIGERICTLQKQRSVAALVLSTRLESNPLDYEGHDQLKVTLELLKELNVKLHIEDFINLQEFVATSSVDELRTLRELLTDEETTNIFTNNISSLEDLVVLVLSLDEQKRSVVAPLIKLSNIVTSSYDFGTVLCILKPEQCAAVCESFKDQLTDIIKSAAAFGHVLGRLSSEQRRAVCDSYKDQLPDIIKSAEDFGHVFRRLSREQRRAVCDSYKDQLPDIIKSAADFMYVLSYLYPEQHTVAYERLKDQLPNIIKCATDFWAVLLYLNAEQRTAVYEEFRAQLPYIIKSAADFGTVLHHLNAEQCILVCESLNDQLPNIIKSAQNFATVLHHLNAEQCILVCEILNDQLPNIIKSAKELGFFLQFLNAEQYTAVYSSFKNQLPNIITSAQDFASMLFDLDAEERTAVYEGFKGQLLNLITSAGDFAAVLCFLDVKQRTAVYEEFRAQLPKLIKSAMDFALVLSCLNLEQCTEVYENFKHQLLNLIKSPDDLEVILFHLDAKQRTAVCEKFSAQPPNIIKSAKDFEAILRVISAEHYEAFCNSIKNQLPNVIKSAADFGGFFHALNASQFAIAYQSLQDQLPSVIKSPKDFGCFLSILNAEQCETIFKNTLPIIIESAADFECVLHDLNEKQRLVVYENHKDQLLNIIKLADDFELVLRNLNTEQRTTVYQKIVAQLPYIIKSATDFESVLRHLNAEQRTTVFESTRDQLPNIINSTEGFENIVRHLNAQQCAAVAVSNGIFISNNKMVMQKIVQHISAVTDFTQLINFYTKVMNHKHSLLSVGRKRDAHRIISFFSSDERHYEETKNWDDFLTVLKHQLFVSLQLSADDSNKVNISAAEYTILRTILQTQRQRLYLFNFGSAAARTNLKEISVNLQHYPTVQITVVQNENYNIRIEAKICANNEIFDLGFANIKNVPAPEAAQTEISVDPMFNPIASGGA